MKLVVGAVVGIMKWVHVQSLLARKRSLLTVSAAGSAGKHKKGKDSSSCSIALKLSGSTFAGIHHWAVAQGWMGEVFLDFWNIPLFPSSLLLPLSSF